MNVRIEQPKPVRRRRQAPRKKQEPATVPAPQSVVISPTFVPTTYVPPIFSPPPVYERNTLGAKILGTEGVPLELYQPQTPAPVSQIAKFSSAEKEVQTMQGSGMQSADNLDNRPEILNKMERPTQQIKRAIKRGDNMEKIMPAPKQPTLEQFLKPRPEKVEAQPAMTPQKEEKPILAELMKSNKLDERSPRPEPRPRARSVQEIYRQSENYIIGASGAPVKNTAQNRRRLERSKSKQAETKEL